MEMRNKNQILFIQFLKLEDEGTYNCVASNRFGKLSRFIILQFKGKS